MCYIIVTVKETTKKKSILKEIIKMTKTKKIMATLVSGILTLIIATSAAFFLAGFKADAATYDGSAQAHASQKTAVNQLQLPATTSKLNTFAKAYTFKATGKTSKGYDWTYKTDYNNVKVKCSYDFTAHKYTFKITGTKYGLNHFTLKYKTSDTKWVSVKMTLFVDSEKNIMRTA